MLVRTTYARGLRIGEVVRLRVADIDSGRGVLHLRQSKGNKDRQVPLSPCSQTAAAAVRQRGGQRVWTCGGPHLRNAGLAFVARD
jgi:integrase